MTKADAVQGALAAGLAGITILGITLQDWVCILSIIFLLMQISWFAYDKWIRPRRAGRRGRNH